jgi:DNA polymerase-1
VRAFADEKELRSFLPEKNLFTGLKAVLGEGDENPQLVVIKKSPNGWDVKANKPLMGKDGLPIRRALVKKGVRFYSTNAFPFFDPKDNIRTKEAKLAAPAIAEELRRISPKKVILLGVDAARWCPAFEFPFKKFNDLLNRNIECNGITFRAVHAPMAIANNPILFQEFVRSVDELLKPEARIRAKPPAVETYMTIQDREKARTVLEKMPEVVACDVETTGLDPYTDRILTIQFSWKEGIGYAFPWELFSPSEWAGFLFGKRLIFQNGQFDVKALAANGVFVSIHEDTLLMHSLVDETPGTHSMELMSNRYLGVNKWKELVDYENIERTNIEDLGRYGARDTDLTLRLANMFRPQVKDRHIHAVLHRAQNAIIRSEIRGIRINRELALQFQEEIERALHDRQQYLADVYGLENANSPHQVAKLLYENLGLPKQYSGRKPTTSEDAILKFADEVPAVRDILEYRHLTKAGSTYVRAILEGSERDGRYHPEFRLAATETGRVAEKLIVLIPRADRLQNPDLGKQYQIRLRELFIPDEGYVMIGADYSGLEVAMAAYLTNDGQLIHDLNEGLDIHSVVAISAFDLDISLQPYATLKKRVTEQHEYLRTLAKGGTFTWLYGGTEEAIQSATGCDRQTATKIMTALTSRYRGVAAWQAAIRETALRDGSVSTPWGRTRRFHFPPGLDKKLVEEQLREAINAPNQGMSSDMNLSAFAELEARGIETLFPLHDAIYAQAPEDKVERAVRLIKEVMESQLKGPVQFRVDVKMGPNWASLG